MARTGIQAAVAPPFISQGQIVGPTQVVTSNSGNLTTDNLYLEFDDAVIPDTNTIVQVLNAALAYLGTNGSLNGFAPASYAGQEWLAVIITGIGGDLSIVGTTLISSAAGQEWQAGAVTSLGAGLSIVGTTLVSAVAATSFNVRNYGAVGNGSADDAAAIQSCINACSTAGGGTVYFPPSGAAYKIGTGLTLPSGVALVGAGTRYFPGTIGTISQWASTGSWIQSTDLINPAVSSAGHGVSVEGLNFIYSQPVPGGSFSPVSYPVTISIGPVGGDLVNIKNNFVLAGTGGLWLDYTTGSGGGTQVVIEDNLWSTFSYGLRTFNVNDTICLRNNRVRNLYYDTTASVVNYIQTHLTGWDCHYTDNPMVDGFEFFECATGILLVDGTCLGNTHALFNGQLNNISFNLVVTAMACAATTTHTSAQFNNVLAQSTGGATANLFGLNSDNANFTINNLNIGAAGGAVMAIGNGTSGSMVLGNLVCLGYSGSLAGQVGISVAAGATLTLGSRTLVKVAGGGAFIAGSGSVRSVEDGYWLPLSLPYNTTGNGAAQTLSGTNFFDPIGAGALQARLFGALDIVTPLSGGSVVLYISGFPEITVTVSGVVSGNIPFNSGYIDLTQGPGGLLGALQMVATSGLVVNPQGVMVDWR